VCVVTGANRGLGFATAEGLARDGATVVVACRNMAKGEEAAERVRAAAGHERVEALPLDLAEPASVEGFVAALGARYDRVDVLVNNAGITLLDRQLSCLGVELGWHVQYLGHYQLTRRLLPLLTAGAPARVIHLAGMYQSKGQLVLDDLDWSRRPWDWGQAGADAQLARVMFSAELAARLRGTGVTVNAVHPGAVRTHAQDVLPLHLRILIDTVMRVAFVAPARGARTVLRLAEDEDLADTTGRWFRRYRVQEPHPLCHDAQARQALWAKSAELLGMEP